MKHYIVINTASGHVYGCLLAKSLRSAQSIKLGVYPLAYGQYDKVVEV